MQFAPELVSSGTCENLDPTESNPVEFRRVRIAVDADFGGSLPPVWLMRTTAPGIAAPDGSVT